MMFWAFRIATSEREGGRGREREEEEEGKKAEIYRKIQWNPLVQLQRCLALFSINRGTMGLGSPGFFQ